MLGGVLDPFVDLLNVDKNPTITGFTPNPALRPSAVFGLVPKSLFAIASQLGCTLN
jgi:hypothetical protein